MHRTWRGLILLSLVIGCSGPPADLQIDVSSGAEAPAGVIEVYVVNYPLQYFAERIGGERVNVVLPVPADADPAYWRPDDETITRYQNADLILLNGATYAKWIQTVTLPQSKMVDTSISRWKQYIRIAGAVTHSHGPGKEHAHGGLAITTWLDPEMAVAQAEAIERALSKARPQYQSEFQQRLETLKNDLAGLEQKLSSAIDGHADTPLVFSHPVYQYMTRSFQLRGEAVHWEPDAVPTVKMREELAGLLKTHPATFMIWEGEPMDENREYLEEIGLRSVVFDPCGNVPSEGDFLSVMQKNADDLAAALSE